MHAWLKRAVAGLLSAGTLLGGGLLTAGTANADEIRMPDIGKTITSLTASAATTYPRELVNGGFDYLPAGGWNVISPKLNTSRGKFTSVDPVNGQYIRNAHVTDGNVAWVKWDGFDASKFGWISDQKGGKPQGFVTDHANSVELQRDNDTDNTYAEIVGSEIGKSIYQKIDTQNSIDAVYTVRFDHAALSSEHADGMQALVNGKPVTMTRIGGNKAGDKTGWTGTDIVTHATNTDHYRHDGQWATYEGKVTIPANTPVSTFMFKSLNEAKPDMGNLIDNLTFKIAYRLSYDSNGGTKTKASQISSMTEGKASETDGKVKTVADDAAGRTVLECKRSGEGATGPYADKFCWIDWSNLPLNRTGEPIPVRINVPDGHIDADATVAHTDNAALTAKDYTGNKWSRLIPAYRLTGNTALAFTHIQGNSADPLASVMFSNITPVANQTATSVNVLKDFQLAFGDAETMSGYVVNDKKIYEQTDIESDKTLDKLGMIGDNNPNQSYSEANTGYGTTHVTLAGGPAGAHALTDEADSKGAAVIGATQPTRFKVSFKQVNHPADDSWSAIAIGVYMPYLTAYPLTYDKNGRDATGSVPSNENAGAVKQAKSKTNGSVRLAADDDVAEYAANGLPDHLVNGDFEYPVKSDMPANDGKFWYISQNDGSYFANGTVKRYKLPEGFDKAKFAWHSTQTGDTSYPDLERADDVQVDYKADGTNHYSEISAAQSGATIYQDVATVPGAMYKWSLKHASLDSSHLDKMSVIIGEPGKETAQEATRTTANGHGDKLGKVGTVISTKVSNPENKFQEGAHTGQWETYTGTYIATGTVTRFAFHSVEGYNAWNGNLLDDISFSKAYKLTYDKNASDATGKVPSNQRGKENTVQPAKSKTTGSVGLAADKTASGLTVHDLKKNDKGKVPSNSKADSTQPAAFKAPDAKVETIASRAAGDELAVNGGFDTPKWTIAKEGQGLPWVYVTPNAGTIRSYAQAMAGQTGVKAGGLTAATFAWQDLDAIGSNQNFELHREKDGNTAADVHAGRTVAQTVNTTPGASYTFSIRHSGRSKGNAGGVTLLTGPDKDHLTPVKLTRTTVSKTGQKYGDRTGDVGTVAYTHSDSMDATEGSHEPWDHSDDWESYEGTVIIPAGQSRTMIAYRGVAKDGTLTASANDSIIDDLSFRLAYKLSYDANGGAKKSTSQIKASTDGKVKTIAGKTDSLPTELVNGSFDYPAGLIAGVSTKYPWDDWTVVDPINGRYARHIGIDKDLWAPIPGWDASKFAWKSTQTKGTDWQQIAQGVELQKDSKTGNQYAELVAGQAGTAIYQDIATIPGVSYRWTLKHASLDRNHLDGMSVMIGEPGKESAQDARRTTVNGNGDQPGDVGKVISTKVSNDAELNHSSRNHDGQWETYTGTYIATGTVTRFTFKSVSSSNNVYGNILDDLSFTKAYRLGYDGNGGTGQVPSRTETGRTETAASGTDGTVRLAADKSAGPESGTIADDRRVLTDTTARQDDGTSQRTITRSDGSVRVETIATTGAVSGCQVYYPAGTRITLATAKADSDCWDSSQIGKTNRTFYGWSANTDANDRDVPVGDTMDRNTLNANVRTEIVMPARAKTVYALWAINPTLSYNVNAPAGSNAPGTPASQTVPYNTAAADKSGWAAGDTGKIPGYRFDGWYTAPNGGNKYDFNTPLTGNVTVYAHWVGNGYTVRFAGNGATGGGTPDQAFQYNIGQNLHRNGFVRDGYTFTGWKRADNQQAYGDGQWVTNLTTQPNGIVTMVAQWSANEAHIRYNPNPPAGKTTGGQGTPNWDGHTGDTPTIGQNGWTIDGYTFAGWATSPDGSGARYAPGARWTANGTLTLYAQWTPGQASLTYDGNGATGGKTDPQTGKTDEKINVRDNGFTRDGYTFVTWNTQADCKGNAVKPNSEWTLRGSSTLYACWAGNAQTLTYHGNGATGGNTAAQSGKTGDELTTNANGFTRDGYTFVRWDTAKDGSGTAYGEGKNGVSQYTMKPAGNDLYAIWKANPASIVYRNGYPNTTGSTPDTTGSTGDTVTVSQNGFDRPGYTFTGWSTSKRGDPSLNPGDKHTLEPGTTTVWAQWKANPAHLVYNSNIGSIGSETRTVDGVVDQTVKTIDNPFDRPGYTFSGWNTQADGKGKAYDPGADCTLTANDKSTPKNTSVLYAQWTINKVTLKFDPNGGVGGYPSINTDAFGSVTIPKDAKEPKVTRPGFRFTGWSLKKTPDKDETLLNPGKDTVSMPAEGEVAVYAQWEPAMTTLPFTGGNAQIPTIWLWAGLAFLIIAAGAFSPMIRLRMGAGSKGRHAGTPTIGRHSR
jgi:uncharacterized repeat protein (TIGR02543 family)